MRLSPFGAAALVAAALPFGLAQGQLGFPEVGPVNPNHGFPDFYKDTNGQSLDLCLTDPLLCLLDGPVTLVNPALPFPDNYGGTFPEESFYQRVDADMPTNNGGTALLVMALEAAFVNAVQAGDQVTFGRLRLRLDNLIAGETYVCTTPFGVYSLVAESAGLRGINFTSDIGLVPGVFTGVGTNIGPFLSWDSDLPILDAAGNQYVGDPAIPHTITGSPTGTNFFRVEGPSVGGPGIDLIETNLFLAMGKLSAAAPPPPPAAPVADFASAPNSGTAPLNVAFSDLSTGDITSWSWSFGDATGSSLQNPSHSYATGIYSVGLTVSGPGGSDTLVKPNLIMVAEPPPVGNALVLSQPVPGLAGVNNALTITGGTPGAVVGVYTGMVLGNTSINRGSCGGIPIALTRPFRLAGKARVGANGTAVINVTPPDGASGKLFFFQAIEPDSCRASNLVSDTL